MNATVSLLAWDAPEPGAAFARLEGRRGRFWLDSSRPSGGAGRFSILGCEPFGVFRAWPGSWEFALAGAATERGTGDPRDELERRLAMYQVADDADRPVPFCGGAVGFLGYEFGGPSSSRWTRDSAAAAAASLAAGSGEPPAAHLGWYDAAAIWDHEAGRAWLVGVGWRRPAGAAVAELAGWLTETDDRSFALVPNSGGASGRARPPGPTFTNLSGIDRSALPGVDRSAAAPAPPRAKVRGDFTREQYMAAVGDVRTRIAEGEIYQMNLAQCFSCASAEPPAQLYRRLRELNPAPMGAYLEAGDWTVLSSSPERFIEVERGRIRTFPIKGTRPRGRTPAEDEAQRRELAASEKERAELLMIVDLMRNDLGRICRFGSVQVRRLHDLETFATVHHLVGEVEGELRPGVGAAEILRAIFPGGSITGAPKIRAMRVIEEIEPAPRGIFSGSIGYWSAGGRIDLNIAIRTIVCHRGHASFHVGAGIVWDSDPPFEYEETLAKGQALLAALGGEWPEGRDGRPAHPGPAGDADGANGRAGRPSLPRSAPPAFSRRARSIPTSSKASRSVDGGPAEPVDAKGVFETVLLVGGRPVFLAEHIDRFIVGCAFFGLAGAPRAAALRAMVSEVIGSSGVADGVLQWAAWEGAAGQVEWRMRAEAPRPHMLKPEWRVDVSGVPLPILGAETAFKHLRRKAWRDALAAARAGGGDEVLLADAAGRIVEGAVSNVFCICGGVLRTPALTCHPLPGIVRAKVLELARELGQPVEEGIVTVDDLRSAEEVFLTNSLIGIRPVVWLDGRQLPAPGPVTARLQVGFRG
jgi:para-aminobenzoate synthetase component 1